MGKNFKFLVTKNITLDEKPSKKNGVINNKIWGDFVEVEGDIQCFLNYAINGHTFKADLCDRNSSNYRGTYCFIIDIDNTYLYKEYYDALNKEINKTRVKTLEEGYLTPKGAIELLNRIGNFTHGIYNTFSNTNSWNRFRIIVVLDEPIFDKDKRDLLYKAFSGIFNDDSSSSNFNKLFYGTRDTNFHLIANENHLKEEDLAPFIQNSPSENASKASINAPLQAINTNDPAILSPINKSNILVGRNNQSYYTLDISTLKAIFDDSDFVKVYGNRTFATPDERMLYLLNLNLRDIFGLPPNGTFRCIFHEDNNPSASIKYYEGIYYYKCFSDNCDLNTEETKALDIFNIVSYVLSGGDTTKFAESIRWLTNKLNLSIKDPEKYMIQQSLIKEIRCFALEYDKFKEDYPLFTNRMKYSQRLLRDLLDIADITLEKSRTINDEMIFSTSLRYLEKITNKDSGSIQKKLDDLIFMGIVVKLSDEQVMKIDSYAYKQAVDYAKKVGNAQIINFYKINRIDGNLISSIEQRLKESKDLGYTKQGSSSRQSKALGIDTRPKASKEGKKTHEARELLYKWVQRTLDRKGIIIKEDLIGYAKKHYLGEKFTSTFIVEICKEFNLKRYIISNELITKHNLAKIKHKKVGFIPKNILR